MFDLKQIAGKATKGKKPTKKVIFNSVLEMIKTGEIEESQLVDLYKFFTPPTPKKPKTSIDWLAMSMSKNDVRNYLNYIYCDGGNVVSTDGHRLHLVGNDIGLEKGFYDKAGNPVGEVGNFPNYASVIPSVESRLPPVQLSDLKIEEDLICDQIKNIHICNIEYNNMRYKFQQEYWNQAVSIMDNPRIYFGEKSTDSILIVDGKHTAVVMGMRY